MENYPGWAPEHTDATASDSDDGARLVIVTAVLIGFSRFLIGFSKFLIGFNRFLIGFSRLLIRF